MIDPVIGLSVRGAFAVLFAFAAMEKVQDRESFFFNLGNYELVPGPLVPVAGAIVITAEVIIATLLLTYEPWWGVVSGCALLFVYGIAILVNLMRGRTWMDCGCLGARGEGLSYWLVARNLLLIAALGVALIPDTGRALVWLDYATILLVVFASGVAWMTFNTLLAAWTRANMWWGVD